MNIFELNQEKVETYIQGQLKLEMWRNVPERLLEYEKEHSIVPLIEKYLDQSFPEQYDEDYQNYSSVVASTMPNPFKSLIAKAENDYYAKEIAYRAFNCLAYNFHSFVVKTLFLEDNHSFAPFLCVMAMAVLHEPERFQKKQKSMIELKFESTQISKRSLK